MTRILAIIPKLDCPTSYWRAVGPLSRIKNARITYNDTDGSWPSLMGYDLVFIQRPSTKEHLEILKRCKIMNVPTWVDYDDNLLSVPVSNPAFQYYGRGEIQGNIQQCLDLADRITVSTSPLRKEFAFNKEPTVIRNAWDFKLFPYTNAEPTKTIVLRGSSTHEEDILTHADGLVKIFETYPEYKWVILGGCPWQFAARLQDKSRVKVYGASDVISYMTNLKQIKPEWFLVPLKESTFNHCKSDIAWLEASYAGAACLGPQMPEWKGSGPAWYSDDIYKSFTAVKDKAKDLLHESRKAICEYRDLKDANKAREIIINYYGDL